MFRMYASNSHSYTHLILALGIVREPTVWGFITSKYPGIHDIGLPRNRPFRKLMLAGYSFGLSRQCLIMRDMETLSGFIDEALPGQFP